MKAYTTKELKKMNFEILYRVYERAEAEAFRLDGDKNADPKEAKKADALLRRVHKVLISRL